MDQTSKAFANIAVGVLAGSLYVILIKMIMNALVDGYGSQDEPIMRMLFTGSAAFGASMAIQGANRFIFSRRGMQLAVYMAASAFIYFYIIHIGWHIHSFLSIFFSSYSFFAFVVFLGMPFLLCIALNKYSNRTATPPVL